MKNSMLNIEKVVEKYTLYRDCARIFSSRLEFINRLSKRDAVIKLPVLFRKSYFVNDPNLVREILLSDKPDSPYVRGLHFDKMRSIVGEGVVTLSGKRHREIRRILIPAFSQRRQAVQIPAIIAEMTNFFETRLEVGVPFDLLGMLLGLGGKITARTIFGEDLPAKMVRALEEGVPVFVNAAARYSLDPTGLYSKLPIKLNRDFRKYIGFIDDHITEVIRRRKASNERHDDLLDTLIFYQDEKSGSYLSNEEIRDQVVTVLFASTETTANTICTTLYEIIRHPDIMEVVVEEIDNSINEGGGVFEEILNRDKCVVLKNCVLEALRLYPSSYLLSRETKEKCTLGGVEIEPGSTLYYSHYGLQNSDRYFAHASEFDPFRWSSGEMEKIAFMPFGFGAYRCLGENIALLESAYFIAMLLKDYGVSFDQRNVGFSENITLSIKSFFPTIYPR